MTELWNAIDIDQWEATPHVRGRVAVEQDVQDGRAVFYLADANEIGAVYVDIQLPRCAILVESGTPVILIQSERVQQKHLVGFRPISGSNGVGLITDFELLEEPDDRFEA
jgi:hypothetical protein